MAPTIWQAVIPSTGEVIAIVRTADEAAAIAPERWGTVYTLAEIAIALDAFGDDVRAVKAKFPDSAVTAVRPSGLNIGAAIQKQSQAARGDPGKGPRARTGKIPPAGLLDAFKPIPQSKPHLDAFDWGNGDDVPF